MSKKGKRNFPRRTCTPRTRFRASSSRHYAASAIVPRLSSEGSRVQQQSPRFPNRLSRGLRAREPLRLHPPPDYIRKYLLLPLARSLTVIAVALKLRETT